MLLDLLLNPRQLQWLFQAAKISHDDVRDIQEGLLKMIDSNLQAKLEYVTP